MKRTTVILDVKSIERLVDIRQSITAVKNGLLTKNDIYTDIGCIAAGKKREGLAMQK